jgi:hypothetical protein
MGAAAGVYGYCALGIGGAGQSETTEVEGNFVRINFNSVLQSYPLKIGGQIV